MAFSLSALFRRNKQAQDPFGGDDDEDFFDEEPEERNLGTNIAFGISGVMGLLIAGFITTAIMTADETAGPVTGAIPMEISQVVSEDDVVLQILITEDQGQPGGETASSDPAASSGVTAMPGLSDVSEPEPAPVSQVSFNNLDHRAP
jgi:hypothetical protein